jgi:hypothetical protein
MDHHPVYPRRQWNLFVGKGLRVQEKGAARLADAARHRVHDPHLGAHEAVLHPLGQHGDPLVVEGQAERLARCSHQAHVEGRARGEPTSQGDVRLDQQVEPAQRVPLLAVDMLRTGGVARERRAPVPVAAHDLL